VRGFGMPLEFLSRRRDSSCCDWLSAQSRSGLERGCVVLDQPQHAEIASRATDLQHNRQPLRMFKTVFSLVTAAASRERNFPDETACSCRGTADRGRC
jgi:hypothetical protein